MSRDRLTKLAMELLKIGVSKTGVELLLSTQDLDEVERQLAYLPYRRAKRPEAFIVEAVRRRYSPPKEFYYAAHSLDDSGEDRALDQDTEFPPRPPHAEPQGHGTPDSPGAAEADRGLES